MRQDAPFERSLAARLIAAGKLDAAAADRALRLRAGSEERLELLTKLGLAHERDVAEAMARELGLPSSIRPTIPTRPCSRAPARKFLRQAGCCRWPTTADRLVLAMADPLDEYPVRSLELLTGKPVEIRVAHAVRHRGRAMSGSTAASKRSLSQIVDEIDGRRRAADEDVDRLRDLASEEPVIRLVNQLIARAVESRASDIHIEPFQNRLVVRYRIDGVLREGAAPPLRCAPAIVSRIKIMAKLNIAERRLPQDGRIRIADARPRVRPARLDRADAARRGRRACASSTAPAWSTNSPSSASRRTRSKPLSRRCSTSRTASCWSPARPAAARRRRSIRSLMRLNTPEKKIFTVEDPIEYQLDGVNQIQVKPQIGLTFAANPALASCARIPTSS